MCRKDTLLAEFRTITAIPAGATIQEAFELAIDTVLAAGEMARAESLYNQFAYVYSGRSIREEASQREAIAYAEALAESYSDYVPTIAREVREALSASDEFAPLLVIPRKHRAPHGQCDFAGSIVAEKHSLQVATTPASVTTRISAAMAYADHLWDSIPDCKPGSVERDRRQWKARQARKYADSLQVVSVPVETRSFDLLPTTRTTQTELAGESAKIQTVRQYQKSPEYSAKMSAIGSKPRKTRKYANAAERVKAHRARKATSAK